MSREKPQSLLEDDEVQWTYSTQQQETREEKK